MQDKKLISIVVSAYNEEGNIDELYKQLKANLQPITDINHEIIFVNDGSRDLTLAKCLNLVDNDPCVKIVNLTRNFGHEVAMTAGMDHAKGDAVIFMDADLQHPPRYIPKMIDLWLKDGIEVVLTKRKSTKMSYKRKIANWFFYNLYDIFSDVKIEHNAPDFRLLDSKYIERLKQISQKERMFKALINFIGFTNHRIIEFEVGERFQGETKYNFYALVKLALDGILQFSTKPLRLITFLGIIFTLISVICAAYFIFEYFYYHKANTGFTTIVTLISIFFAFQTVFISILGEYIGRIHLEVKNRPLYFADLIDHEKVVKFKGN